MSAIRTFIEEGYCTDTFICARCELPVSYGFWWRGFADIVVCESCAVPMVAAMIYDVIKDRFGEVQKDTLADFQAAVDVRLKRISKNLDKGKLL